MPLKRRLEYLREIQRRVLPLVNPWNEAASDRRGTAPDDVRAGETMIAGPGILTQCLRILAGSLEEILERGAIQIGDDRIRARHDGQVVVEVLPDGISDRLVWTGLRGEVWLDPEVRRDEMEGAFGGIYGEGRKPEAGVGLVLGAGNVDSIPALDAVHELFDDGQTALVKFNPVNEYAVPAFERIFGELIEEGFVRLVTGGADVGAYLTGHDGIDSIHITGSTDTHDRIVFGAGEEGERRRRAGEPLLSKPITSELGNVSPAIVVPGEWTKAELQFQAENVATQIAQNGGFNCNATKVIITSAEWPQREEFLGGCNASCAIRRRATSGTRAAEIAGSDSPPGVRSWWCLGSVVATSSRRPSSSVSTRTTKRRAYSEGSPSAWSPLRCRCRSGTERNFSSPRSSSATSACSGT